jgi:hypothetical protein
MDWLKLSILGILGPDKYCKGDTMPQQDYRARLQPKLFDRKAQMNEVLGENSPGNILFPLWQTGGVLFPYTPSLSTGSVVEYDQTSFIHTNYGYSAYVKSYPKPMSMTAEFTAQTNDEALYLLAVLHFFRSVTKSYFGINPYNKAGTPPPVLVFNYLGQYQFNNVPVLVKSFDYTYPSDIDYVPVNTTYNEIYTNGKGVGLPPTSSDGYTYVPTHLTVTLEMDTQYTPIKTRNEFNLDAYRSGKLLNKGYI